MINMYNKAVTVSTRDVKILIRSLSWALRAQVSQPQKKKEDKRPWYVSQWQSQKHTTLTWSPISSNTSTLHTHFISTYKLLPPLAHTRNNSTELKLIQDTTMAFCTKLDPSSILSSTNFIKLSSAKGSYSSCSLLNCFPFLLSRNNLRLNNHASSLLVKASSTVTQPEALKVVFLSHYSIFNVFRDVYDLFAVNLFGVYNVLGFYCSD